MEVEESANPQRRCERTFIVKTFLLLGWGSFFYIEENEHQLHVKVTQLLRLDGNINSDIIKMFILGALPIQNSEVFIKYRTQKK